MSGSSVGSVESLNAQNEENSSGRIDFEVVPGSSETKEMFICVQV